MCLGFNNTTVINSLRSGIAGQLRKKVDMVTSVATVCLIASYSTKSTFAHHLGGLDHFGKSQIEGCR